MTNVAGGVEVEGFALNVRTLALNLIKFLEAKDVKFNWRTKISRVSSQGEKTYLHREDGEIFTCDKAIITSGVNSPLVHDSKSKNIVQGVAGFWLTMPNISGIKEGFKIHEADPIGVINVTISPNQNRLFFSGGFAYTGQHKIERNDPTMAQYLEALKAKAAHYLPEQYQIAAEAGDLQPEFCIRPMTPDGMPVMEKLESGAIYVSGTNSGGFTEAPIIASIVANMLESQNTHVAKALSPERHSLQVQ